MSRFTPLQDSIIARRGYRIVDDAELDQLAPQLPFVLLFFAGDGTRITESNDAAVILAELDDALKHTVTMLVVNRASERALQIRYRFAALPAFVFLKHGQYLGCIERLLDWSDYLREIPLILAREPQAPPPLRLPEHCMPTASTAAFSPDSNRPTPEVL